MYILQRHILLEDEKTSLGIYRGVHSGRLHQRTTRGARREAARTTTRRDGGDESSDESKGGIKQRLRSIRGCTNNSSKPSCQQGDAGM